MRAQRQLVADASHELRTPVTSLRTNIEVLLAGGELGEEDRRRLLADVVEQSEELSALVGDLIELARGDQPGPETEYVRLDRIVAESVARARRNAPGIEFHTELAPTVLDGVPERLGRAINNLLDNASRHSPPGGVVEVTVDESGVRIRDHGPGVPEADLPYVFDRFFRGSSSRGRQGSGLGLAIVRQVTEQHGGTVAAANAPDGGAVFTLSLPVAPVERGATGRPRWPSPARVSRASGPRQVWREPASDWRGPLGSRRARRHRPRHPRLPGRQELAPQQPEQDREHGHHDHQQQRPRTGLAEDRHQHRLEADRRDRRQQRGVGAVAGEVLARCHFDHAERAHDDADHERRPAALDQPNHQRDAADQDRQLRDRKPAERARGALSLTAQLTLAALALLLRPWPSARPAPHAGSTPRRWARSPDCAACASAASISGRPRCG